MHEQITKRVRRSVQTGELAGEAMNARIAEIKAVLKNWIPGGGMESLRLYEFMQAFHILPYPGGWLDQPKWFINDVENFMLWHELESLRQRQPVAKPGMKGISQVTGGGNG